MIHVWMEQHAQKLNYNVQPSVSKNGEGCSQTCEAKYSDAANGIIARWKPRDVNGGENARGS